MSRPGSPVAALHLMFRGRACAENGPPTGLAELLVTLLESSAGGKILAEKLDALGARLQFGDNPYMPQDDYLLNPSFAFVRLEAPARSMREASGLLIAHLLDLEATADDLDAAKQSLVRETGMRSASPAYTMRTTMIESLFRSHPFAVPLFPSPGPMMRVPMEDLAALRERLFAGRNVIATLVSPETAADGCATLKELLAGFPAGAAVECPPLPEPPPGGSIEKTIRKEGAYIAAGWLARTSSPSRLASLMVAGEALSRRMQLELREKQGLSYSIECGVTPYPGGAVVIAYLSTGAPRIEEARSSLEREIRGLAERPPDEAEVEIAKNRLLGKRARSELSSINAAYALGFDLLLCGALPYQPIRDLIAVAPVEGVREAVETILPWDGATVLKLLPEAAQGKQPGPEAPRGK
jgi:zinc protease